MLTTQVSDKEDDRKPNQSEAKSDAISAEEYISCKDFVTKISSEKSKPLGRLLFLRGFPSVEWLGLIGAKYRVDPEFFMRFLHFIPHQEAAINYSLPPVPAATWNILELPIITIGERKVLPGMVDQIEINNMRKEARQKLQRHHDLLRAHENISVASSVVRNVSIIDHSCFALEQCIWVCLQSHWTKDAENVRWTRELSVIGFLPWLT